MLLSFHNVVVLKDIANGIGIYCFNSFINRLFLNPYLGLLQCPIDYSDVIKFYVILHLG